MLRRAGSRLLPLALVATLAAIGCGDDDALTTTTGAVTTAGPTTSQGATTTGPTSTSPTTAAPTTTTPAPTTAATTTTFDGDVWAKSGPGDFGLLTDIRIGDHAGFTRIVFDFQEPSFPNWEFGYSPGEVYGMIEPEGGWVAGSAFLIARFQPSGTADISGVEVVKTYLGQYRISVGVGSVVQLLLVEDFEAHMWWAIGLTAQKPFRVGTLTGPPRVYVDIAH